MSTVLFVGFFMSLFLVVLLLGKKNKMQADKILLFILAVYALTIGGPYIEIYNRNNHYPYPHLMNIAWLFLLLHGPLLWFYIKSLVVKNFQFVAVHLLHLLPFMFFLLQHYFTFLNLPAQEKILIIQNEQFTSTSFFKIRGIAIGISSIAYNVWALLLLKKHKSNIENQFSNIENKDLRWLKTLALASLLIFLVNVLLFNLNNYLHFAGFYQLTQVAYSLSTIYVLYIGYFGIKQSNIFVDIQNMEVRPGNEVLPPKPAVPIVDDGLAEIRNKLLVLMEKDQPYLDPELSLPKLSQMLQIKPEYLSVVLNSFLNQNFFDFINRQRIEEFKLQCLKKDNKHLSIIGIAYECGFNSKAAFYRAFKKHEGISPGEYISKVS